MVAALAANTRAIETMMAEQKRQGQLLNKVLNQLEQGDASDLPEDISFPVRSVEELEMLDIRLVDKAINKAVVSIMAPLPIT